MVQFSLSSLLVAAIVLSNCITWTASRHHYTHNVSGHRSRHRRQGKGLNLLSSYVIPGGEGTGWGAWENPSPCSRTCGGGVASQKRICLQLGPDGQPQCTGGDTMYFSCQTQDCPPGSGDFRAEQCAFFNNVTTYRGTRYKWIPYTKGPNPCELNCMPPTERFYYRHKEKVIDGTRCNDESFDVCVNGTCQPVGCDMMLGSNAREDKCRNCRGNGKNCYKASGLLDTQDLLQGYNDMMLIPEGATTIVIREVRPSNNYLALRAKNGTYYLNGDYHIDFPKSMMIAGALWYYERSQQGFNAPDKLRCLGPINEPLYLSLLLQSENVGIEYEYSLPSELAPRPTQKYNWVAEDFTPCSATCGGGTQTRNVTCRTDMDLDVVDDALCDVGLKPEGSQACNQQACPPEWVTGEWEPCSKRCGEGGVQSRDIRCEKIVVNGLPSVVSDKECFDLLGPKPEKFRECNVNTTCPQWFTEPWKPCDTLYGEGKQTRKVICYQKNGKRVDVLQDSDCADEKPETERSCMVHPDTRTDWMLSDWVGCDTCMSTVRTRVAKCTLYERVRVDDKFCAHHPTPVLQEPCDTSKLPSCEVQWYATQWGKCSTKCGNGTQTRRVFCGIYLDEKVSQVDDSRCSNLTKYKDSRPCTVPKEECPSQWYASGWTKCSKECGEGVQTRRVMCMRGDEPAKDCDAIDAPESTQTCNPGPCNEDEIIPVDSKSPPIMDIEDCDYEEEEYPEVGLDIILPIEGSKTTLGAMMSDSPASDIGSGMTPLITGSETETTDEFLSTEGSGSGSSISWITDDFTTESTDTESTGLTTESELTTVSEPFITKTNASSALATKTSASSESAESTGVTESTVSEETDLTTDSTASTDFESDTASTESTVTFETESTVSSIETTETTSSGETTGSDSTDTSEPSGTTETILDSSTTGGTTEEIGFAGTDETTGSDSTESTVSKETTSSSDTSEPTDSTVMETKTTSESSGSTETAESSDSSTTEEVYDTDSTTESGTDKTVTTESTETDETSTSVSSSETTEATSESETTESETTESTSSESTSSEPSGTTEATDSTSSESTSSEPTGSTESTITDSSTTDTSDSSSTTESVTDGSGTTESASSLEAESTTTETATSEFSSTSASSESSVTEEPSTTETVESSASTTESGATEETTQSESTEAQSTTSSAEISTSSNDVTGSSTETSESSTSSGSSEAEFASTTESGLSTESTLAVSTEETSEGSSTTESGESTTAEGSTTESISTESSTFESESTTLIGEAETGSEETTISSSFAETSTTEAGTTVSSEGTTTEESSVQVITTPKSSTTGKTIRDWGTTVGITPTRKCRRRRLRCGETAFGCCPDRKTPAKGPYDEGCPRPRTCKESEFGCCPDGVSPVMGPLNEGCPPSLCAETLFGCCLSDNKTAAEGNDQEGCPPPPPACQSSTHGCCADGETEAKGPDRQGCPEITTTEAGSSTASETETASVFETTTSEGFSTSAPASVYEDCFTSEFGCCYDNETAASAPGGEGCPCNATEFGCCPDGVSEAKSANMDGCPSSCSTSPFGCCSDGKTPAHGPDNEGCCLLSAFGCCPDNYKPAEGPHLEGCGCQYARYGCCPDNATLAKGPNNEGCGCQYTTYGCCPDRHTEASGPHFEGCGCHTYQFGCCPDGVTIAKGPSQQGCDCTQSPFGCCGDGKTPASGPERDGCDCASSEFGCCPDGQTEAKGHKFFGCSDIPVNRQAACSQTIDRGSCRNFSVYWYYDLEYGGCSRFWYGGCEGNGNRFATKEECEDVCVQPAPKDACNLPKVKGACTSYYVRWYYDSDREDCSQFVFGGCLGNANNFETRELCLSQCQPARTEDQCNLPIERGSCAGNFGRWGFNSEARRCEQFIWGGCEGNTNRFSSEAACIQRCDPPGTPKPQCKERQDVGNCSEKEAMWSFSQTENRCLPFYYTGCGGNDNRFDSEERCAQACPSAYVADVCTLPADRGECDNYRENWFYDTAEKMCRLFHYGGCGGNGNNFASQEECERRCTENIITTTTIRPTEPPAPGSICFIEPDPGPCTNMEPRWTYDSRVGRCVEFEYGGCGGNQNNFPTERHCQYYCSHAQDICQLPMLAGPCDGSLMRWFYDPSTDSCSQFTYGGCEGNDNRFDSRDDCERRCRTRPGHELSTTTHAPATSAADLVANNLPSECAISSSLEACVNTGQVWYRDPAHGECVSHDNVDSGVSCRNTGVFPTQEACERTCGAFRDINVCRHDRDPGPCRKFVPKYYFDRESGDCREFVYGGCHGGPNRFSTIDECRQVCRPEMDPCKLAPEPGNCLDRYTLWYYDSSRDQCQRFLYGGCGGNDNRFETRDDCERRCRKRPEPTTPIYTTTTTLAPTTVGQPIAEECRTPYSLEPCGSNQTVFYYDHVTSTCLAGEMGGCRYANSYRTEEECERRCGAFRSINVCEERLDPGPCRASIPKIYWDLASGRCQQYAYGGCGGSANRFSTIDECEEVCGSTGPAAACLQPVSMGSDECGAASRRWYYSVTHADCLVFVYKGCAGTDNNFVSYEQCADLCKVSPFPGNEILPPDCSGYDDECLQLVCPYGTARETTPEGCTKCSCVEKIVDCSAGNAECDSLRCPYGIQRTREKDGCEKCKCYEDPCLRASCVAGRTCVPIRQVDPITHEPRFSASCRDVEVPNEVLPDCDRFNAECAALSCEYGVQRTRTVDGCERCSCVQVEVNCEPLRQQCQTIKCNYGVEKYIGVDGCERCLCTAHPCDMKECGPGDRCVAVPYMDPISHEQKYSAECRTVNKTGYCPLESTTFAATCTTECKDDADCRGVGKCCSRGCSQVCLIPDPLTSPTPITYTTTHAPDLPKAPQANQETEPEVVASEGSKATLRCLFHGNPPPKITWRRGEITIEGDVGRYRLLSDGALEIVSLYRNDSGVYICVAENDLGSARQEIQLQVSVPVATRISAPYTSLNAGSELSLTCEVDGYPEPETYWARDGKRVIPNDNIRISGSSLSRLTVLRTAVEDSGTYECHAQNAYSSHFSYVQITVQAVSIPAKCTDSPFFANCRLIVRSKYCQHKYYSKFCCKSCLEAGQLTPQEVEMQADQPLTKKK